MGMKSYPVIDLAATGKNIARLRKARGLTVSQLQKYFGFDAPQAIYKWQQGKSLPSTDNLYALSEMLGVSMNEILVPKLRIVPQEAPWGDHFFGVFCPGAMGRHSALSTRFNILGPNVWNHALNRPCFLL